MPYDQEYKWNVAYFSLLQNLKNCSYFICKISKFIAKYHYHDIFGQVWINNGDIILLGLRDFQDTKADVILKYSADEARNLKAYGELPESSEFFIFNYQVG